VTSHQSAWYASNQACSYKSNCNEAAFNLFYLCFLSSLHRICSKIINGDCIQANSFSLLHYSCCHWRWLRYFVGFKICSTTSRNQMKRIQLYARQCQRYNKNCAHCSNSRWTAHCTKRRPKILNKIIWNSLWIRMFTRVQENRLDYLHITRQMQELWNKRTYVQNSFTVYSQGNVWTRERCSRQRTQNTTQQGT
jgi:hypothetical protein